MKKLFFFRSNNGNNNHNSPPSADKKVNGEKTDESALKYRIKNHDSEEKVFGSTPRLRRSLSFSSGSVYDTGKEFRSRVEQNGAPSSMSYYSRKHSTRHPSRYRTQTPEKQTISKLPFAADNDNAQKLKKSDCVASRAYSDFSEVSSYCSSNVSSKVLDRYIDGEQQVRSNELSMHKQFDEGNVVVKRPPRFHCTEPGLPHDARKQKPASQSFKETKLPQLQVSCRTSGDDGFNHKSPHKLAREVIERLSQPRFLPEIRVKEVFPDSPITIEDIYGRSLTRYSSANTDETAEKNCMADWRSETDGSYREEISEFSERPSLHENTVELREDTDDLTETDLELLRKLKEAEDRAALLSEELEGENFVEVRGLSLPMILQIIKNLTVEKVNMALEVSAVLQDRIAEKALFWEKLKLARAELDSRTRKLEKEKNELQSALEKELDRRSIEWSLKLEKYQEEEHRLRERLRELAEQNVRLQRDVSTFSEKEMDSKTKMMSAEKELESLTSQVKEVGEENHFLKENFAEMINKSRQAEEDRDCIKRNYEAKVTECKDMHQAISRLRRTCSEQEKTIDGLRGFCEELGKKISHEDFNFGLARLQMEQMRLTEVEHVLRKEVESSRLEIDSLRRENVNLLNRLKNYGNEGAFSSFKLDQELHDRVCYLQDQALPLLAESGRLCRKLLENTKSNDSHIMKMESNSGSGLDDKILEYEVELQRIERTIENLTSSALTISSVLHEKSKVLYNKQYPAAVESKSSSLSDESLKRSDAKSKDVILSELKAETLLTSLLREKLYSKECSLEQLQAELAASVRINGILRCEVQNAMDNFSCVNHKMKDLELQMMQKDGASNQLEGDLQECKKELALLKGLLPKVSEEKDHMWDKVKQYSESNMLLKSEINAMRKKIEALDEDILIKEGQITILKDSINKPFNLLASPDSTNNFGWKDPCFLLD